MILRQFYLNCLAHASYLVGDATAGIAAVVDPQRDIDQYLSAADADHLKIAHVILTHFHADFVAGHLELREKTGATIYLGASAKAEYPFVPLHDGDVIDLGEVQLKTLETPGHTAESISVVVFDRSVSTDRPQAVLTGDTLFVGDVGRPDLRVALGWSATDLGGLLYESLQKLLELPDTTLVYPAHGAGSLCGKALSTETVSTIGEQRRLNYALQPMTKTRFIELVTADQPDAPDYFTYDAVLNTKERPTLSESLARELTPLSTEQVLELQRSGAQVLDTRDPGEFATAHLTRSINIGLGGQFATWAGTLLSTERPIVVIADPGRETEAATRLGRIGFDHVAGYLADGMLGLRQHVDQTATTERVSAPLAAERLASSQPPMLIDVRTPREYADRRVEGSLNIPLNRLPGAEALPSGRPILLMCAGGYRSAIAASVLQQRGYESVAEVAGGVTAWEAADLPLQVGKEGDMSEEHKAIARRFYQSVSSGNLDVIDEVVAEDMVEHETFPGLSEGRAGVRQFFEMMRSAFGDFSMTINDILAEGDRVVIRARMSGTHRGEFAGLAPTGKQIDVPFADFIRFENGRVVEHWGVTDGGAMMEQLGAGAQHLQSS